MTTNLRRCLCGCEMDFAFDESAGDPVHHVIEVRPCASHAGAMAGQPHVERARMIVRTDLEAAAGRAVPGHVQQAERMIVDITSAPVAAGRRHVGGQTLPEHRAEWLAARLAARGP